MIGKNEIIKNNLFSLKESDELWILGDLGFSFEWIAELKCKKYLILGNHDKYTVSHYKQYFDEVYGKTHRLDVTGLDIIDEASNAKSHTDANSIDFYNSQGDLESQFSKALSITDNLIVNETIKMGNYITWRLDDNNILEYFVTVINNIYFIQL